tara:strand:+ start:71 stop:187 length:117 start_codon:yes stop_codon:yes gene_type:complete
LLLAVAELVLDNQETINLVVAELVVLEKLMINHFPFLL